MQRNSNVTTLGGVALESHLPCSDCGSSDALSVLERGTKCHACDKWTPTDGYKYLENMDTKPTDTANVMFTTGTSMAIKDRKITKDTAALYGVTCTTSLFDDVIDTHIYPYYIGNKKVGQKLRKVAGKKFFSEGNLSKDVDLFGQQLFPKANKQYVVLTEGELDAMAAYQMLGGLYPCMSVPNGASSIDTIKKHFEYLNNYRCIVLAFDNDKVGQESAEKIAKLFSAGKCKVLTFDPKYKDPCDYLVAGKSSEFVQLMMNSSSYKPSGIVDVYDLHDKFLERRAKLLESPIAYPWQGLNDTTYGLRTSEVVILTAETGIGKTESLRSIQNHILQNTKEKLGVMYIEEDCADTYGKTMGMMMQSPIHLPDTELDMTALEAEREKVGKDRMYAYDHFGSIDFDEIMDRIRYFATVLGCRFIILDHISMLVSDQRYQDERKALDAISTKLKSLTIELDICILAIVHLNREGQIRGSAAVEQLANIIIRLERDHLNADITKRHQTKVMVTKNRFSGKTGQACVLQYDHRLNTLTEIEEEGSFDEDTDM